MKTFINVQKGHFVPDVICVKSLTGCTGIVKLDNMISPFFDLDTIPKSYRRIMYNFLDYNVYSTGIKTPAGEELKVFARVDQANDTLTAIRNFIKKPWKLAEYTYLPCVPKADKDFPVNFWWAVDFPNKDLVTDWIAFLGNHEENFIRAINQDYFNWWMEIPYESRQLVYMEALE